MGIKINIDKSVLLDDSKGNVVLTVSGNTVGDCLAYAVKHQPNLKKALLEENCNLRYGNLVRVNGEFIPTDPLDKQVKDGDEIGVINLSGG